MAIKNIFLNSIIPSQFQIDDLHQNNYLLDGKLCKWKGEASPVQSAIYLENDTNNNPTGGEKEISYLLVQGEVTWRLKVQNTYHENKCPLHSHLKISP